MLDPRPFGIVSERIQRGSWNVIVDPIDRAWIARPWIGLQVVDANASGRPRYDSRILVIDPDFASLVTRGRQMQVHNEGFFGEQSLQLGYLRVSLEQSQHDSHALIGVRKIPPFEAGKKKQLMSQTSTSLIDIAIQSGSDAGMCDRQPRRAK
jgi:hypothetical protein